MTLGQQKLGRRWDIRSLAALEDDDIGTREAGQHWETMTLGQEIILDEFVLAILVLIPFLRYHRLVEKVQLLSVC